MPTAAFGAFLLLTFANAPQGPLTDVPFSPEIVAMRDASQCRALASSDEFADWLASASGVAGARPTVACSSPTGAEDSLPHRMAEWTSAASGTPLAWSQTTEDLPDGQSCRDAVAKWNADNPPGSVRRSLTAVECVVRPPATAEAWLPVVAVPTGETVLGNFHHPDDEAYRGDVHASMRIGRASVVVGDARPSRGECEDALAEEANDFASPAFQGAKVRAACFRADQPTGFSVRFGTVLVPVGEDHSLRVRTIAEVLQAVPSLATDKPQHGFATRYACTSYGVTVLRRIASYWPSAAGGRFRCQPTWDDGAP